MKTEVVVFGGGCFWCTEAIFLKLKGVASVTSGYAGGITDNPNYYEVSEGNTQHAETIEIVFDQDIISFQNLLAVFFAVHNPTIINRQGNDVGTEYRSIILYTTEDQKQESSGAIEKINSSGEFDSPVVTEVVPLGKFYPAEDYHQNYFEKNIDQPYCAYVIQPKLEKLRSRFADLIK